MKCSACVLVRKMIYWVAILTTLNAFNYSTFRHDTEKEGSERKMQLYDFISVNKYL